MNRNLISNLRVLISGVIIFLCLILTVWPEKIQTDLIAQYFPSGFSGYTLNIVVSLILGYFYSDYVRFNFQKNLWGEVDANVKTHLLGMLHANPQGVNLVNVASSERKLMRIFYEIIDNDAHLKGLSETIMHNGLKITTFFDLSLILGFFAVFNLGFSLSEGVTHLRSVVIISFIVASYISFTQIERLKEKHIELGSDQLDVISRTYPVEFYDKIKKTFV